MRAVALTMAALVLCAASGGAHEVEHGPSADAFLEHAYELLAARQPEKALAYLQFALEHYPLDRGLTLLYLDVLREEALEVIGQPIYLDKLERYSDEPLVLYANGVLADDDAESYEFYKEAIKLDKKFARAYVGVAEVHFRRGDLDAAEETLARALEADPACGPAYALWGEIYVGRGELEKAVDDFEQALEYSRYAPAAHADLAAAYLEMAKAEAARDEYRRAIAVSDDRGEYYLGLGRALEELGEPAAARLAYETAFSRAYGNLRVGAEARKAAGRLAFEAGDLVTAAEYVGWAVAFMPDDAELHGYLGKLYMTIDRPDGATPEFERAVELAPEDGEYWHLLGRSRAAAGELEGAREALERAVELLPEAEAAEARRELEEVRARLQENET
jgi:tetratricopeptide (TPR) repeat protein